MFLAFRGRLYKMSAEHELLMVSRELTTRNRAEEIAVSMSIMKMTVSLNVRDNNPIFPYMRISRFGESGACWRVQKKHEARAFTLGSIGTGFKALAQLEIRQPQKTRRAFFIIIATNQASTSVTTHDVD